MRRRAGSSISSSRASTFMKIGGDGGLQEYLAVQRPLDPRGRRTCRRDRRPPCRSGTELILRAIPFNRGYGSVEYRSIEDLLTIDVRRPAGLRRRTAAGGETIDRAAANERRHGGEHRADARPVERRRLRVRHQRRAVRAAHAGAGQARRHAAVDGEEQHQVVASDAPARLLLPGAG